MSGSGPARELNRSRMAEAALQNEALTRERVATLERHALAVGVVLSRSFWGRLRWLLLGR